MLPSSTTMTTQGLRQRQPPAEAPVITKLKAQRTATPSSPQGPDPTQHPAGKIKHGFLVQTIRMSLFALYFNSSIIASVYPSG